MLNPGQSTTNITTKSYSVGDIGNSGTHFFAGFIEAPASAATLLIGDTVTQTLGTAGEIKAAHAFVVASGAGGTDLVLTVTGVSITDAGVKNDSDSEVIVADCDTATIDQYYETSKKWLGQVTFTLTGTADNFTFNYGFVKYEDFGNRDFILLGFEAVGRGSASESALDIKLLHHNANAYSYSASAFDPCLNPLISSVDDCGTNDNLTAGDNFAYKRTSLSEQISGSDSEGLIICIDTAVNNSISSASLHIGVTF